MQCVIFAAGKGTRMQPLTLTQPKPLVMVGGLPILTHILDTLPKDIDSYLLVVKYRQQQIRDFYGDSFHGVPITYVEQTGQDGTGGALLAVRSLLTERFMVMNGDDLHGRGALETLVREPLAILGAISNEPQHFGVLTVSPEDTLLDIEEKPLHPKSNLINTGTMVLDQRVFQYDAPTVGGEVRLTDMVTSLAKDAPIRVVTQPLWCPIGRPEDIATGEAFLATSSQRV